MLYSQSLSDAFMTLFDGMSLASFVCITVGLSLVIVEFFQSTKWICGALGFVLITFGIVLRMATGGNAGTLFVMLIIIAAILFISHIIMLYTQKRDWLVQSLSLAIEATRKTDAESKYSYLIGLSGTSTTEIDENGGHVTIDDVNFFVVANGVIACDSLVRVIEADGEKIIVEAILSSDKKRTRSRSTR